MEAFCYSSSRKLIQTPKPGLGRGPGAPRAESGGRVRQRQKPSWEPPPPCLWPCCFSGEVHLPQPHLAPEGACVPGADQRQLPGPLLCRVALPDEQKAALRRPQGTSSLSPRWKIVPLTTPARGLQPPRAGTLCPGNSFFLFPG